MPDHNENVIEVMQRPVSVFHWQFDITGRKLKGTKGLSKMLSLDLSSGGLCSRSFMQHVDPEDSQAVFSFYRRLIGTQEPAQMILRICNSKGETRRLLVNGEMINNSSSKADTLVGHAIDLTDGILSQQTDNLLSARLKAIFHDMQDGILLLNDSAQCLDANPAATRMFGYGREEFSQLSIFEIFGDVSIPGEGPNLWGKLQREAGQSGVRGLRRKDGNMIWCHYAMQADIVPGLHIMLVHDISKQKRFEKHLIQSEVQFRTAFENAAIGMALIETDGAYKAVNKSFCDMLKLDDRELLKSNLFDITHPDDRELDLKFIQQLLRGEIETGQRDKRYIGKDGNLIWASVRVSRVKGKDGNVLHFISQIENITEKKQLERTIQNEQRRFSDLFFEAPVSMCILKGENFVYEKVNDLYLRLTGRSSEIIGKPVSQVLPELQNQGIFDLLEEVYQTGQTFSANERLVNVVSQDGRPKVVYINLMFQPYRNLQGEVEGIFYFGVDVTEQVLARKKTEQSEKRYRTIVETAQEGIWLLDERHHTVFVNKKMTEIIGYSTDEMTSQKPNSFLQQADKFIDAITESRSKGLIKDEFEMRFESKAGEDIWLNLSTSFLVDESGLYNGCLAMATDITARKYAEEELKRLSLIAQKTINAVIITDPFGRISWVNDAFTGMTEFTVDEAIGKECGVLLHGMNTNRRTVQFIEDKVRQQQPFECEIQKYSKSGRTFWVQVQGQPLFDADGKLTHYFAMETDITERKNTFERLVKTENEVRTFAKQINTVLEDERARIAREIHDEFGQQLSGLKMSLSVLRKLADIDSVAAETIKDMQLGIENTMQSLRKFSTELRPGILDTLGLGPSIEWLARGFEKKTGIKCFLHVEVREALFEETLSMTFFRICQEALTNIIKHAEASQVYLELTQGETELIMRITDNGKGIDPEKMNDPFTSGLLGMRERAKILGAELSITSPGGLGTCVQLISKIYGG